MLSQLQHNGYIVGRSKEVGGKTDRTADYEPYIAYVRKFDGDATRDGKNFLHFSCWCWSGGAQYLRPQLRSNPSAQGLDQLKSDTQRWSLHRCALRGDEDQEPELPPVRPLVTRVLVKKPPEP